MEKINPKWELVISGRKKMYECSNCKYRIPTHKDGYTTQYIPECPYCHMTMQKPDVFSVEFKKGEN